MALGIIPIHMPAPKLSKLTMQNGNEAMTHPQPLSTLRSGALNGSVNVPGDKSISHRALIFGALAIGETEIEGLLESEDVMATARALQQMGVSIERTQKGWRVIGVGLGGLRAPSAPLDFGNAGTGVRLMMGVIAGHAIEAELTGDDSLRRRPMGRVLAPLRQMGAQTRSAGPSADLLPLTLIGSDALVPIEYRLPVASAQVKSAVLLAGLSAPGETTIIEPEPTRDHTETMLSYFGAELRSEPHASERAIILKGQPVLHGRPVAVPGDPSSAAFAVAAALMCPGSDVTVESVLINPTRIGFYETLLEMGADLVFENNRVSGGEPVADIRVRHAPLRGVIVPPERAPRMIDEYPVLAVLSALAAGETRMQGLAELRVKESDRLAATVAGLTACGVEAHAHDDMMIVRGASAVPGGGLVETHMDHRIAMAFLVLGLAADAPVTVDDTSMIATSFPGFVTMMRGLGAEFHVPEDAA